MGRTGATGLRAALLLAALSAAPTARAQGPVLLESAQLGATGLPGGTSLTDVQLVGWRFEIDETLHVSEVGGHLIGLTPGLFAAIVRLDAVDVFPAGDPFAAGDIVAYTIMTPPFPSAEFMTPLVVTLPPGAYALVFGSGLLGATGLGAIPNPLDQPDIPPTTIDSYIFYAPPFFEQPPIWREGLASNMRFLIRGQFLAQAPALPPGAALFLVLASLLVLRLGRSAWTSPGSSRRRRRSARS